MSRRGRRFDTEPHLNYKKVFAVFIVIALIIGIIFAIKYILSKGFETGKITSDNYYALYAENKWGVIDNTGNEVIPPAYQELIKVPNSKKDVFLCTYDVNPDTGEYKTKALNSKNEEIFTDYDQIEPIENLDKNNNLWYEEDVLKVEKGGKYGLIDLTGKEILPCEYDNITVVIGIQNSIKIEKDGKFGLVTAEGKIILEPNCKDILNLGDTYKEGYITVDENDKYGVIDYMGKQLLENKYEKIEQIYSSNSYVITEAGKQKLINPVGEVILESGYDAILQILSGTTAGIVFEKDGKIGVMGTDGTAIIPNEYEDIKEAKDGTFIAKKDGKYGIIDNTNTAKVDFTYTNISYNKTADIYTAIDEAGNDVMLNANLEMKAQGILIELDEDKGYLKIREKRRIQIL